MRRDRTDYDEYYDPPHNGSSVQTANDAMGIGGGKRVNNLNRDDVANHITACETWGYLNTEQAQRRRDAAGKAQTEGELFHLVRDLPNDEKLAALGVRRRFARMAHGSRLAKVTRWLLTTRLGRAVFHLAIGSLTAMLAILPGTIVDLSRNGHFGTAGAVLTLATAIPFGLAFIVNLLFCITWYIENG